MQDIVIAGFGKQGADYANLAVEFVEFAARFDARIVLGDPGAAVDARSPLISSPCVDSVCHSRSFLQI